MENGQFTFFLSFWFLPNSTHNTQQQYKTHTHAHTLTHSHTHTTINKAMPTLAALPAASLLSLAKRTTTITSSVGGSNNFAVVHKKKFLFRCERVSVAVAVAVSDFASFLSCILYLLHFIVVDIMYYIFYTLQCYSSHTFINDFFTFLPQYKTPSPVAA